MKKKDRAYFRPLRKTYRPLNPPLDPEIIDRELSASDEVQDENVEWTAEEWERIWRSTSA